MAHGFAKAKPPHVCCATLSSGNGDAHVQPLTLHPMTSRRQAALFAALLPLATILAYLPAIRGGYIWDDDYHVTNNETLRSLNGLRQIWIEPGATVQYYPLTHTTF